MNLFQIIKDLQKVDEEVLDRLSSRRAAFGALGNIGKKMALAATPVFLGSMFNKALAGTNDAVSDVLNYATLLEQLEEDFYKQALASPALVAQFSPEAKGAIELIKKHESAHVTLLKGALAGNYVNGATKGFDFTTAFPTVFTDYATFLTVAQALEDTGVRAYKGQAGALLGTPTLTIALQIHSVEARHASHIRYMRRAAIAGTVNQAGWITLNQNNGAPAAIYAGEQNVSQSNVNLTSQLGTTYSAENASEAFDEILTKEQVFAIAGPFIKV